MEEADLYSDFGGDEPGHSPAGQPNGKDIAPYAAPTSRIGSGTLELSRVKAELQVWQDAFTSLGGSAQELSPYALAKELQLLRANDQRAKEQLEAAERRDAAAQVAVAERTLENLEMRAVLTAATEASTGPLLQVRSLLLEPAVAREFRVLRQALDDAVSEGKRLKEELQAMQFTQESKAGRMLMAKCRALQEENEELGKELSEGKVATLERQLVASKAFMAQMRRAYGELEDHCAALDDEAEQLQQQVANLQQQLANRGGGGPLGGQSGAPGGFGGRRGPGGYQQRGQFGAPSPRGGMGEHGKRRIDGPDSGPMVDRGKRIR